MDADLRFCMWILGEDSTSIHFVPFTPKIWGFRSSPRVFSSIRVKSSFGGKGKGWMDGLNYDGLAVSILERILIFTVPKWGAARHPINLPLEEEEDEKRGERAG